jgi:prevent-host-death family protein
MQTLSIQEAKKQFSKLVETVSQGKEIVIAKAGKPIARMVPMQDAKPVREPGSLKGKIRIADDFEAPLPTEILAAFEGKSLPAGLSARVDVI